jgi:hypothetical protein
MKRVALATALVAMLATPALARAQTFTVVSSDDVADGTCPSETCNLRQAINSANASPGLDRIVFAIPPGGSQSIHLTRGLPPIVDPVEIDGSTQPGYDGVPLVEIDGTTTAGAREPGLDILAGNSIVEALRVVGFYGW